MLTIRRPDDLHLHVRDGEMLQSVVAHTSQVFGRALVMPNTEPPVLTGADAERYRKEIAAAVPQGHAFEPLMTIKLVPATTPRTIRDAKAAGVVAGKLYPEGVTTEVFEAEGALDAFDDFCSGHGARFYGPRPNPGTVSLVRDGWTVPDECDGVVPLRAGATLPWRIAAG